MRFYRAMVLVILFGPLPACDRSNSLGPTDPATDPFAGGGQERNRIVVVSDLHLGADPAYAEIHENLKPLEHFLEKVGAASHVRELVIAGDLLDEWFVPATTDTYAGKDQRDFIRRIAAANPGVIDALNRIIQAGEITVTYVPGNHDLAVTAENVAELLPGIRQARDAEQGLGVYSPAGHPEMAIEHGHRYDFFCSPDPISNRDAAPGSIMPPGYFFTRIAALHVAQQCHTAGDTLPVVTRNVSGDEGQNAAFVYWEVWKKLILDMPVENKFEDPIIVTRIDGFTRTYSIDDLIPYQSSAGGTIDVNLFKGIYDAWDERQTLNRVAVHVPAAEAIAGVTGVRGTDDQAEKQYFLNPESDARIVIFGHTHDAKIIPSENLKGQKTIYGNSGTWIDHHSHPTTMNFIVITPRSAEASSWTHVKLFNFEGEAVTEMTADSLRL
jgi:UDP-2,3-diacylglucosamine pyrophosphatase LpxH